MQIVDCAAAVTLSATYSLTAADPDQVARNAFPFLKIFTILKIFG